MEDNTIKELLQLEFMLIRKMGWENLEGNLLQ